jgi:NTE family protein
LCGRRRPSQLRDRGPADHGHRAAQEIASMPNQVREAGRPSTCVLALQGGGALGAYHIGAYKALSEQGIEPDWLSGISIGAINCALIAGNPPAERIARLEALWHMISWPEMASPIRSLPFDLLHNSLSNAEALLFGQPHFFRPRPLNPWFAPAGAPTETSFYDTSPMLETLGQMVDFDRIRDGPIRLTLGATDIETGRMVFFDSRRDAITPAHVLASGSLPPGFPAVEIAGRYYWDGGCVSNSPAQVVVEDKPRGHVLIIMIDLWNAEGKPPTTMAEVLWRAKQIQYASRGELVANHLAVRAGHLHGAPQDGASEGSPGRAGCAGAAPAEPNDDGLDIVHVIYQPGPSVIPNSDAEFSRSSIARRQDAGYRDMRAILAERPWDGRQRAGLGRGGVVLHRMREGALNTHAVTGLLAETPT